MRKTARLSRDECLETIEELCNEMDIHGLRCVVAMALCCWQESIKRNEESAEKTGNLIHVTFNKGELR